MPEPTKPESAKPDLNYTCPHCGQPAVLGNHFCTTTKAPPAAKPKAAPTPWWPLLVTGLAVIGLWRYLGPASLLLVALAGAVWLLWPRKK